MLGIHIGAPLSLTYLLIPIAEGYQTKSTITVCAGDSVKFNWDEQEAMDKYQEFNRFSNPVSAAALADCPQLWNSQVSEEEKGSKTYKQSSPVTKYFATARRYRGGRWQCEGDVFLIPYCFSSYFFLY